MKLTEIAIDGLRHFRHLRLGKFADGLNFVYGENSAGKSSLRHFVRHLLFGPSAGDYLNGEKNDREIGYHAARGHLVVRDGVQDYRLDRDESLGPELRVQSLNGAASSSVGTRQPLATNLNVDLYDSIFSFSFHQTRANAPQLSRVLQTQLGVPRGQVAAADAGTYQAWKRESETRASKLHSLQQQAELLTRSRADLIHQRESGEGHRRSKIVDLDRQLEIVVLQISGFEIDGQRNQLSKLDREISELRILIEETLRRERMGPVTTIVAPQIGDPFAALYQRLDEIDNQIRRWRRVQTDIQSQRVRLKDEMVVWNDLTLESNEHPYHNAREILVALEQKVDATERHATQWNTSGGQRDPGKLTRNIQDICRNMRDDLYGLCQELSQQYKHIRHKAAAAELKQLRRCYHEMGENTDRLVRRRESVIKEIRSVDPAGADAIVRSENGFCQCAMHEGYLEARRRFVGPASTTPEVAHRIVRTDLSEPRRRLASMENQRQEIQNWLSGADSELLTLKSRHAQLVRERESLRNEIDNSNLNAELLRFDGELRTLNVEIVTLLRLVEEDRRYVQPSPNAILIRAANLLERVTEGELLQVWLSDSREGTDISVRSRLGKILELNSLESAEQDQAYLSLAIAAKEALAARGIEMPILIDDAFANINRDRLSPTLEILGDLARSGHQIILLTQHQYLADRIPGSPVFELPPSTGFTQPVDVPERKTSLPMVTPIPVRESNVYLPTQTSVIDFDAVGQYDNTSTYPLSKYPPIHDVTEYRDQSSYIVPYSRNEVQADSTLGPYPIANPPGLNARSFVGGRVTPVAVDDFGDQLGFAPAFDDLTELGQLELFDVSQLQVLSDVGVDTIGQLLEVDPERAPLALRESGISADRLNRWQSYVWLLSNVSGLRHSDARILVACGVTEPEHLATSHGQQLFERIQRFHNSNEGQRFAAQTPAISLDRINGWLRALNSTRSRWERPDGYGRQSRRAKRAASRFANNGNGQSAVHENGSNQPASRDSQPHDRSGPDRQAYARDYSPRPSSEQDYGDRSPRNGERESRSRDNKPRVYDRDSRSPDRDRRSSEREPRTREPFVARETRMSTRDPRVETPRSANNRNSAPPIPPVGRSNSLAENAGTIRREVAPGNSANEKSRFYLEPKDHIQAAPSIGPKTAERFEKIGVQTVADFLKQTAESMAAKLKYKRITADVVRAWQHQARLVCRVPNLRGHDAQLLVACDFTEPETIATMQPKQLFSVIGPFASTKDGQKIIRTGKSPDLAEITDWITWAAQTRSLQAA